MDDQERDAAITVSVSDNFESFMVAAARALGMPHSLRVVIAGTSAAVTEENWRVVLFNTTHTLCAYSLGPSEHSPASQDETSNAVFLGEDIIRPTMTESPQRDEMRGGAARPAAPAFIVKRAAQNHRGFQAQRHRGTEAQRQRHRGSLFGRLGYSLAVDRVCVVLLPKVQASLIGHYFAELTEEQRIDHIKAFVTFSFGGPADKTSRLKTIQQLQIDNDGLGTLAGLLATSLRELKVSESLIAEVLAIAASLSVESSSAPN
jgi:hypothetical protein